MQDHVVRALLADKVALLENEQLSAYTGFRTGGLARFVAIPESISSFCKTISSLQENSIPYYILGKGKNVLAPDEGYGGVVVLTTSLKGISVEGSTIRCEAGVLLQDLCLITRDRGLSGMEFAYGIPGTVGGAVFMNAGAFGGEMKDVVSSVKVCDITGKIVDLNGEACEFGYRKSRFQEDGLAILAAEFKLRTGDKKKISSEMDDVMRRRKEKQPLDYPSCGSTFKRPEGSYASKLMDDCGLKGAREGGAMVSEKHAGFLINYENASSSDILRLIERVRREVKAKTDYELQPEIRILK